MSSRGGYKNPLNRVFVFPFSVCLSVVCNPYADDSSVSEEKTHLFDPKLGRGLTLRKDPKTGDATDKRIMPSWHIDSKTGLLWMAKDGENPQYNRKFRCLMTHPPTVKYEAGKM